MNPDSYLSREIRDELVEKFQLSQSWRETKCIRGAKKPAACSLEKAFYSVNIFT